MYALVWKFDSGDPLYIVFLFANKYARALQRIIHFVDGHPNNLRFKALRSEHGACECALQQFFYIACILMSHYHFSSLARENFRIKDDYI